MLYLSLRANLNTFSVAGSDTSSTTITYILWELSRRPDILSKLQSELDEAMVDSKAIPDISILNELPYLNAVVKEGTPNERNQSRTHADARSTLAGLRVYTAAPSLLERVVPTFSSKPGNDDGDFDLMGYPIPAGTIVSTQAWSMHRNPNVFTAPDVFSPERWQEASTHPDQLAQMHQHLISFGTGTRVCGGQNLAQVIMRIVLSSICRNFTVIAPRETTEKSMEMKDSFVRRPLAFKFFFSFLFPPYLGAMLWLWIFGDLALC